VYSFARPVALLRHFTLHNRTKQPLHNRLHTAPTDITWQCFVTDPYPAADHPEKKPSNRRFVHYYAIAKCLGVKGGKNRAKLPPCVQKRIAALYIP
jgi:hypothetical protein